MAVVVGLGAVVVVVVVAVVVVVSVVMLVVAPTFGVHIRSTWYTVEVIVIAQAPAASARSAS